MLAAPEDQSRAILGCFILIDCWIKSYPDTRDTFFLIGYCIDHFFVLADKWHLTEKLGETCLIPPWGGQRGQVMFARCVTLNSLEFFFSVRNTMCGGSAGLKTEMSDCHAHGVTLESLASMYTKFTLLLTQEDR